MELPSPKEQTDRRAEKATRLCCGALVGMVVGIIVALKTVGFFDDSVAWLVGVVVASIVICAGLAFRMDRFFSLDTEVV